MLGHCIEVSLNQRVIRFGGEMWLTLCYSCRSASDYSFRHALADWTRLCGAFHLGCGFIGVLPGGDLYHAVEDEAGIYMRVVR